ncbi:MAG TPA: DUF4386 domain-containing protein [Cyclobacteriaceae bacterium]|nr:DUF4386 domain-containing protein [Cyclobacteriaceae bacterium]HMV09392.1 DUF4386 domain-containing protein [Cyclobacteriaceae bacterium]HMV91486.1 DUF4386 domain-containing protein [Cyclobacteriaceae bacterium]HMX00959.1 DUF4386 domain-containing protein [Cyclobacteriaceae bacterium]HMX51099.1 DUF4386 domain-containing protein [Cyclobacteriaceae bacterium]
MKTYKLIGVLMITGAIALFIPYNMLIAMFEYPDILRQSTATILTKFHEGGDALIWTWFAFAVTGLPLLPAYILLGRKLEQKSSMARLATTVGVTGLIVQMIGLLRWTFVVPVLADSFVHATDEPTRAAAIMAFRTIHQFAGVILGEHLGQLFTIAWTVMISYALYRSQLIARWVMYFGYVASLIYLLAQAELFATVMPSVPVWDLAGFIGSTLWLIWLVIVGVVFVRRAELEVRS